MIYRLLWSGRLWSVEVPEEIGVNEALRWTYVQTFVATEGSHSSAMCRVLSKQYPGLAYGPVKLIPVSFASASHDDVGVPDMSGPVGSLNNCSQMPRPPSSRQPTKGGGSGISAQHTPTPRSAKSSSSRPRAPRPAAPAQPKHRPRQNAMPHTGGWMGLTPTNVVGQ
jgi:hypothetical protein